MHLIMDEEIQSFQNRKLFISKKKLKKLSSIVYNDLGCIKLRCIKVLDFDFNFNFQATRRSKSRKFWLFFVKIGANQADLLIVVLITSRHPMNNYLNNLIES
ncbi:hypothetical protein BpHYR1_019623 [Brachionus plicatilis]|uniref:Uncharacterized protein n=1 Tax=Brachionus plicatilis TaxID=10195 RepID=A0A3M7QEI6_BRAPC|nr:hypothetical protein BpHYR1_019623 [Brachionus plicatilis]